MTQQVEDDQPDEPPPPMDLVVMNPPFTRDSLRHDQFTRAEEEQIKRTGEADAGGERGTARLPRCIHPEACSPCSASTCSATPARLRSCCLPS